jgi:hypothetical protein
LGSPAVLRTDAKRIGDYEVLSLHHGGAELRRSRRYKLCEVVLVEKPMEEIVGYAELHNFSSEGMLLRSTFGVPQGETILVRLNKPLLPWSSAVVSSKVVWCRYYREEEDIPEPFGIGVAVM